MYRASHMAKTVHDCPYKAFLVDDKMGDNSCRLDTNNERDYSVFFMNQLIGCGHEYLARIIKHPFVYNIIRIST